MVEKEECAVCLEKYRGQYQMYEMIGPALCGKQIDTGTLWSFNIFTDRPRPSRSLPTFKGPIWLLVSLSGVPSWYGLVGTDMLSLPIGGIAFEGLMVSLTLPALLTHNTTSIIASFEPPSKYVCLLHPRTICFQNRSSYMFIKSDDQKKWGFSVCLELL